MVLCMDFKKILMIGSAAIFLLGTTKEIDAKEKLHPKELLLPKIPGNPQEGDGFGQSVCLNGRFAFVSSPFAEPNSVVNSGAIYVYKQEGSVWKNTQIITTGGAIDNLGLLNIVSQGNWLIFSAPGTPLGSFSNDIISNQNFTGAAIVYHLNEKTGQWELRQTITRNSKGLSNLTPVNPLVFGQPGLTLELEQGANFGLSMSLDIEKKVLLVGAETQQFRTIQGNSVINAGAVYAFALDEDKKKWVLEQTITNPDGISPNNAFGFSIATHKHLALIGTGSWILGLASDEIPKPVNSAAYLYQYQKKEKRWKFVQKIIGDQVGPSTNTLASGLTSIGDAFGSSLALSGSHAVIGAGQETQAKTSILRGAVYFYKITKKNGKPYLQFQKKFFSDSTNSYAFALTAVALRGKCALVGDPVRTGPLGARQGAVLIYQLKEDKWKHTGTRYNTFGEAPFSCFGSSISMGQDHVIVGQNPTNNLFFDALFNLAPLSPYFAGGQGNTPTGKAVIFKRVRS